MSISSVTSSGLRPWSHSLPHHQKGTHMSRFLEVLNDHAQEIDPTDIMSICHDIRERLNAADAHLELTFTYFINKPAPVTGSKGLMDYEVTFEATSNSEADFVMGVKVPATSLCPCSKTISAEGYPDMNGILKSKGKLFKLHPDILSEIKGIKCDRVTLSNQGILYKSEDGKSVGAITLESSGKFNFTVNKHYFDMMTDLTMGNRIFIDKGMNAIHANGKKNFKMILCLVRKL